MREKRAVQYLEIEEVIKPKNVLPIVRVMLLQKLQQLDFIQTLIEKIFAVFDDLGNRLKEGTDTRQRGLNKSKVINRINGYIAITFKQTSRSSARSTQKSALLNTALSKN